MSTPLVSTAVGVVEPARAGMASGINSTLRQVGIATGVAGARHDPRLARARRRSSTGLSGTPLAGHAHALAHAISTGGAPQAIASTPRAAPRPRRRERARSALVGGLNTILLIGAIVAFAAAVASFVLIRERDFVAHAEAGGGAGRAGGGGMSGSAHRVVVVGGGFAGLQAVRGLRRAPVEVTLVDRQNYTLFQPLVYQVATGALSPAEIAMPLRADPQPAAERARRAGRGHRLRPRTARGRPRPTCRTATARRRSATTRSSSPAARATRTSATTSGARMRPS